MKAVARRRQGYLHDVEIEGGFTILSDEPVDAGGTDAGPSPTRLLAASLAACTATTMEMYADAKEWDVGRVEVDVGIEYDGVVPAAFEVTLRLPENLSELQRRRLLDVAARCPVHRALTGNTVVSVAEKIEPL